MSPLSRARMCDLNHFQISFEAKAPPGYTFIPAGNPQLTNACKDICRADGLKVFAVTVSYALKVLFLSSSYHIPGLLFTVRQLLICTLMVFRNMCIELGIIFPVLLLLPYVWI